MADLGWLVPPELPLRNGTVALRLPDLEDAGAIDRYASRAGGLEGGWLPVSRPASTGVGGYLVADWRQAWAGLASCNGPAFVIAIEDSPDLVGVVGIGVTESSTREVVYGVAPQWRGRGLATQAARLVAEWLIGERGVEVVELRIGSGHIESQRVAAKAGFQLVGTVEDVVEKTGEVYQDLRFVCVGGYRNEVTSRPQPRGSAIGENTGCSS